MSRLIGVTYRLLEFEADVLETAGKGETHVFGGELVLAFETRRPVFVSWVSEPVQYAIGSHDASHFRSDAKLTNHDVSSTPLWTRLVGQEVALTTVAADNQALKIFSASDYVMVCAFERGHWWADAMTICQEFPEPYVA